MDLHVDRDSGLCDVTLEWFDYETVKRMVEGLYTGDYTVELPCYEAKGPDGDYMPDMLISQEPAYTSPYAHARVVMVADQYGIEELKEQAMERLKQHWLGADSILLENMDNFIRFLDQALQSGVFRMLMDALCIPAARNLDMLYKREQFTDLDFPSAFTMKLLQAVACEHKALTQPKTTYRIVLDCECSKESVFDLRRSLDPKTGRRVFKLVCQKCNKRHPKGEDRPELTPTVEV
ncbi:hypothetical protein KEM56_002364 [Ascosphaera pollenicola]|nr:hypothetical protein KEM56_002364 [Ascosphaera pollenicola]